MTALSSSLVLLFATAVVASSGSALAQTATATATNTAAAAPDPGVHDRVLALVQARKCDAAHDEAVSGGDEHLAQQVTELCGLRPTREPKRKSSPPKPGR